MILDVRPRIINWFSNHVFLTITNKIMSINLIKVMKFMYCNRDNLTGC